MMPRCLPDYYFHVIFATPLPRHYCRHAAAISPRDAIILARCRFAFAPAPYALRLFALLIAPRRRRRYDGYAYDEI